VSYIDLDLNIFNDVKNVFRVCLFVVLLLLLGFSLYTRNVYE